MRRFDLSDVHQQDADERIIAKEEKSQIVTKLHHILKPFLLRRLKADGGRAPRPRRARGPDASRQWRSPCRRSASTWCSRR